ncbi:hypothetical protein Tco_1484398, partial [Tanacetum coccineum]
PIQLDSVAMLLYLDFEWILPELNSRMLMQPAKTRGSNSLSSAPGKAKAENEAVTKERFERTKSSLKTELKDLRDR